MCRIKDSTPIILDPILCMLLESNKPPYSQFSSLLSLDLWPVTAVILWHDVLRESLPHPCLIRPFLPLQNLPLRNLPKQRLFLWGCQLPKCPSKAYYWAQTQFVKDTSLPFVYRGCKSPHSLQWPCDFSPGPFPCPDLWKLENSPESCFVQIYWAFTF